MHLSFFWDLTFQITILINYSIQYGPNSTVFRVSFPCEALPVQLIGPRELCTYSTADPQCAITGSGPCIAPSSCCSSSYGGGNSSSQASFQEGSTNPANFKGVSRVLVNQGFADASPASSARAGRAGLRLSWRFLVPRFLL
ncbi:hypothetical protein Trydic_g3775 [Trypoxylus dichotomus]